LPKILPTWIRLKGHKLILKVVDGVKFINGEPEGEVAT